MHELIDEIDSEEQSVATAACLADKAAISFGIRSAEHLDAWGKSMAGGRRRCGRRWTCGTRCDVFGLEDELQRYFDYHHSDKDTLDKVHPRELELGSISMAVLAWLIAENGV